MTLEEALQGFGRRCPRGTNLDVFQPEGINVSTIGRFAAAVSDLESAEALG